MAILTYAQHEKFCFREPVVGDRGIFKARLATEVFPNNGKISLLPLIEKAGYPTPDLITFLQSQSESGLWLTGSTLACAMGISTHRVKSILRPYDYLGNAVRIPIPEADIDRAVTRLHQRLASDCDIDLLAIHLPGKADLTSVSYYQKQSPQRLIVSSYGNTGKLSMSITDANDPASIHRGWGTTLDLLTVQVNPDLSVNVPQQEIKLSIEKLSEHYTETSPKALRVARHYVTQSLSVKDGKRIPVNFGSNIIESMMLTEFLTNNLTQIFQQKGSDYLYLLATLELNWELLDLRIKNIAITAFQQSQSKL